MRIYYHDARVRVDSSAIAVRGRLYPLVDIQRVWRIGRHVVGRRAANACRLLAAMLLAQVMIGLVAWWTVAAGGAVLVTAVVVLTRGVARLAAGATALRAIEDVRRYGRRLELWASVSGTPRLLFSTDDAIRYGQVCRALARALENCAGPASAARSGRGFQDLLASRGAGRTGRLSRAAAAATEPSNAPGHRGGHERDADAGHDPAHRMGSHDASPLPYLPPLTRDYPRAATGQG